MPWKAQQHREGNDPAVCRRTAPRFNHLAINLLDSNNVLQSNANRQCRARSRPAHSAGRQRKLTIPNEPLEQQMNMTATVLWLFGEMQLALSVA